MEVHREKEQSAANGIVIKNVTDEEQRDLETNREYITGSRLWLVLSCLTLVTYLMALDLSIIVTVNIVLVFRSVVMLTRFRLFLASQVTFIHFQISGGMEAHSSCQSK